MCLVMRKLAFCICENKDADQLISAFFSAIRMVQPLYYLNPKFQASSNLLWLYSPVCVGPGRNSRRPVFSQRGSYDCVYSLSKDIMYWGWSGTGTVQPSHIEATSYALLAQLQLDDLKSSSATVTWLSQHRSSGGAFKTTQVRKIHKRTTSQIELQIIQNDESNFHLFTEKYLQKNISSEVGSLGPVVRN